MKAAVSSASDPRIAFEHKAAPRAFVLYEARTDCDDPAHEARIAQPEATVAAPKQEVAALRQKIDDLFGD
ncbi:MAG: hypothetical protein ABR987_19860 [Terracidiphilus sp.]